MFGIGTRWSVLYYCFNVCEAPYASDFHVSGILAILQTSKLILCMVNSACLQHFYINFAEFECDNNDSYFLCYAYTFFNVGVQA